MAVRGQRPTATLIKLVTGRHGRGLPAPGAEPTATGRPKPPAPLEPVAAKLWKDYIAPAPWLSKADSMKAYVFCVLGAEFLAAPDKMLAAKIGQWRVIASDLGFDPTSRARIGGSGAAPKQDKVSAKFFSD